MGRPKGSVNRKTLSLQHQAANLPVGMSSETDDSIKNRLKKTFRVLDKVIQGVVEGRVRSAVITGAPGCGKTFAIEDALTAAADADMLKLMVLKGTTSPLGLFATLYRASSSDSVLLLDDCDAIFYDVDSFNLLKIALDTNKRRVLSWNKQSKYLDDAGIPTEFQFEGSAVFISNKNMADEVNSGSKMAPHYSALISRSVFVDLGIHSKREIYLRIQQVIEDTDFLEANKITQAQATKAMKWISDNLANLLSLSVRTVLQLGNIMHVDPDWVETAEVTLLRRS